MCLDCNSLENVTLKTVSQPHGAPRQHVILCSLNRQRRPPTPLIPGCECFHVLVYNFRYPHDGKHALIATQQHKEYRQEHQ